LTMVSMTALLALALASAAAATAPWDAVVRIEVAAVAPSYLRPWEKAAQQRQGGTGFIISDNRILTNHHVIENAVDIRLSKTGNSKRWRARVSAVGPDVDLAILEIVEDAGSFFADLVPVVWSDELPALQSRVTVRGYPLGGNAQSVTEGVVSRVDARNYRLGATSSIMPGNALVVQIDAAINGGNSGGPCFDTTNRVVGVAFQGIDGAQSIGYIIPAVLAKTFLASSVTSSQFRLVDVPFRTQHLENRALRRYLKVPDSTTGVVVSAVSPLSALAPPNTSAHHDSVIPHSLRTNDVLTHIDGVSIGDDGSVPLRPGERVAFDWLITRKHALLDAPSLTELTILRHGQPLTLRANLTPLKPPLPRWHEFDCLPEWLVIGGLVFAPLTAPLIEDASSGGVRSYVHDIFTREVSAKHGFNTDPTREVVVLLDVLTGGDVNHGYEMEGWKVLSTFNGQSVRSLAHLYAAWQRSTSEFLEFSFGAGVHERQMILESTAVRESEGMLLGLHGIPSCVSARVVAKSSKLELISTSNPMLTAHSGTALARAPYLQAEAAQPLARKVLVAPKAAVLARPSAHPPAVAGFATEAVLATTSSAQTPVLAATIVGVDSTGSEGIPAPQVTAVNGEGPANGRGKRNGHRAKLH